MEANLKRETEKLIQSWMQHEATFLRDYLVAEVEDPRINVQSILTRHFLIEALVGNRFAGLMEQELRFAAVMNWWLKLAKRSVVPEEWQAIRHALDSGADNAEGLEIPHFVSRTFAALPTDVSGITIPNYLDNLLASAGAGAKLLAFDEGSLTVFQLLWRNALEKEPPQNVSVLEPACGSANDYRFLDAFGLARLLDYTGFDLCEKNVCNARAMFPKVTFEVGNVFEIHAPDRSFDFCFVHDLLEHFSIPAMEQAVAELCRVTGNSLCVGFFNMNESTEHFVRPTDDYHWNTLSQSRTNTLFEQHGFSVQAIQIDALLRRRFDCDETHNKNAYTFLAGAARPCWRKDNLPSSQRRCS